MSETVSFKPEVGQAEKGNAELNRPVHVEANKAKQAEQIAEAQAAVAAEAGKTEHVAVPSLPVAERPQLIDREGNLTQKAHDEEPAAN